MKNIRTKIEATLVVSVLLMVSLFSVLNATTVNPITQDTTVYGFIKNSKGNMFPATGVGLKSAIWDLNSTNGGTVWLPSTTITISSSIKPIDNLNIYGNGATLFLIDACGASNYLKPMMNIGFQSTDGPNDGFHNILIDNIVFDGNNDSQTYSAYFGGIFIYSDSSNITIHHCTFKNICSSMIGIDSDVGNTIPPRNIVVDDCNFDRIDTTVGYFPAGVWVGGVNCKVTNCNFNNTYGSGVVFENYNHPTFCHNNIVSGCSFNGYMSVGIWMEAGQGHNNTAIGNTIRDIDSSAYVVSESFWSRGIVIGQPDTKIIGNTIQDVTEFGIYVSGNRVNIEGNTISKVNGGGLSAETGNGIYFISPSRDGIVNNNVFMNCARYGVFCRSNTTVSNNLFIGGVRGVSGSTVRNLTITGNKCYGQSSTGILVYHAFDCIITSNNCYTSAVGFNFDTPNRCVFLGNNGKSCTTPFSLATSVSCIIRDNVGWVNENWGVATTTNNATISHGLATTPTVVIITCGDWNLTCAVNTLAATTFKVSLRHLITNAIAVGPRTIYWYAKV